MGFGLLFFIEYSKKTSKILSELINISC